MSKQIPPWNPEKEAFETWAYRYCKEIQIITSAYPELVELLKQCQGLIAGSEYANGEVHTLVKILLKKLGEV